MHNTPTYEEVMLALQVAVDILSLYEPGDSRAVSNEFVALAYVSCGCIDEESKKIIVETAEKFDKKYDELKNNKYLHDVDISE
jgi:hypothetical protein